MKSVRIIMGLALLAAVLSGCDAFLASKLGRWNPEDPNNELVPVSKSVSPSVDGYVQDMDPQRNFSAPSLFVSEMGPYRATLLVFDELPYAVDSATLQLECLNGSGWLDVYPIARGWSPDTITYYDATSEGFVDDSTMVGMSVAGLGPVILGVTPVIERLLENGNYGILLCSTSNTIEFARGPTLQVTGADLPE